MTMMNVRARRVTSLRVGLLLVVGAALLIAPQVMAEEEEDDFNRAGPYIGARFLGGSFGRLDDRVVGKVRGVEDAINEAAPDGVPDVDPEDVDHDPNLGFDLYAGYRLHKNVAVEGEFEMMLGGVIDGADGAIVKFESWLLSAAVKGILPIGRLQPYVSLGVGYMGVDVKDRRGLGFDDDTGVVGRAGGGVDYYLTSHIVANFAIDYTIPSSAVGDYDYLSFGAGIQYRF